MSSVVTHPPVLTAVLVKGVFPVTCWATTWQSFNATSGCSRRWESRGRNISLTTSFISLFFWHKNWEEVKLNKRSLHWGLSRRCLWSLWSLAYDTLQTWDRKPCCCGWPLGTCKLCRLLCSSLLLLLFSESLIRSWCFPCELWGLGVPSSLLSELGNTGLWKDISANLVYLACLEVNHTILLLRLT